ncbi:hypothetical protein [Actinomadura rifamycini]|uniref:hypothetical protein n=1 Tax=Actinomadura rifamycini TaxID=31962 RepID=UPI0012F7C97A|nr:hypothetical protein [Actinomadura rifamycini]
MVLALPDPIVEGRPLIDHRTEPSANSSGDDPRMDDDRTDEDAYLALALVTVWALRSGRPLPAVPLGELTTEELETFWADEQMRCDNDSHYPCPHH